MKVEQLSNSSSRAEFKKSTANCNNIVYYKIEQMFIDLRHRKRTLLTICKNYFVDGWLTVWLTHWLADCLLTLNIFAFGMVSLKFVVSSVVMRHKFR